MSYTTVNYSIFMYLFLGERIRRTTEKYVVGKDELMVECVWEMKWCFRPLLCTLFRLNWAVYGNDGVLGLFCAHCLG